MCVYDKFTTRFLDAYRLIRMWQRAGCFCHWNGRVSAVSLSLIRKLFSVVADYEIFPFKVDDISPNYRYYVSHTSIRRSNQPVSVSRYCQACELRQGEFYMAKGVNGCFVLWHVLRIYFPRSRKVDLSERLTDTVIVVFADTIDQLLKLSTSVLIFGGGWQWMWRKNVKEIFQHSNTQHVHRSL